MQTALYGIYLFLAVFNAGNMTTLQFQHYGIYPFVGKENFKSYMQANNKSALIPSILPAMLLLLANILLFFERPVFLSMTTVCVLMGLNLMAFFSTFTWQRKIQGEMAVEGYNENKVQLLISTNWIRTFAFLLQAIIVIYVTMKAIS